MPGHQIGTHIGRRSFLAGVGTLAATTAVPGRTAGSGTNTALAVRGVNYDTDREPALWKPEFVAGEMAAIADDLRCDSVILLGHDFDRLLLSAERARASRIGGVVRATSVRCQRRRHARIRRHRCRSG